MLFSLILFLAIGIVSASQNTTDTGDIGNLIDECKDQGTIKLDEKTYELNPDNETHLYLNKTISIEGTHGKTVIDGKNSTLYLDVEKEPELEYNGTIIIAKDIYDVKNTGKHIIFKNITFKDLNLISRHNMSFLDCKFTNTNFTSKELNNSFDNCVFDKSKIELNQYDIFRYTYYSKIINCTFYNSTVTSKTNIFLQIVGSSRVFMQNSIELINSSLFSSDITLSHYNINMTNLKFHDSNLKGWSDIINITNTSFANPVIDYDYTDINFEKTIITNAEFILQAGYYEKGCKIVLKDSKITNSTFGFDTNIGSRPSNLIIQNSSVDECEIKTADTNIKSHDSNFNKSTIELYLSNLNLYNSIFYNDGNMNDTIKTIIEDSFPTRDENGTFIEKIFIIPVNTSYTSENSYFINNSGKYEINDSDINVDTSYRITFDKNIPHHINENITFNVKDYKGNPVSNFRLTIKNSNNYYTVLIFTDEKGNANYTLEDIGELTLKISYEFPNSHWIYKTNQIQLNLTVNPKISDIKLIKDFKFNKYSNINSFLELKTVSNYTGDLSDIPVIFKVFTGNKYKAYRETTDSNGDVVFEIPTKLDAGTHKIQVIIGKEIMKTTSIKIDKARTIVKAPKVTNKYKKSRYFKVTIKNKETKKMLSNVKVKIKVFTGKKFKTYTAKTNKKGKATINTKNLKIGTHKVVISSANNNYKISAKSAIKIKK